MKKTLCLDERSGTDEVCFGELAPLAGRGRTYAHAAGLTLAVPDEALIMTCRACGALHPHQSAEGLEAVRGGLAHRLRELVEETKRQAQVSQRQLEKACGVTPTYLSHAMSGKKEVGTSMVRLLQAYARHPNDVRAVLGLSTGAGVPNSAMERAWASSAPQQMGGSIIRLADWKGSKDDEERYQAARGCEVAKQGSDAAGRGVHSADGGHPRSRNSRALPAATCEGIRV